MSNNADADAAARAEALSKMSNAARAFYALDSSMMRAHRANTEEDDKMAVNTARTLVEDADAPLLVRARACMVLRCSTEDDYFVWATEAVRTAELILEVTSNVGEAEEKLMASCRKVLEAAEQSKKEQEEHDKREAAKEDGEVETKATDQGDEEGEGEG
ncbi:hypothetical protein LTR09_010018 [Extremus antarcticus]|uniref:Uncharacterized protein n=1 Tax=Extremus antarcticus TaxID=702011 RepID=A0AAJ0DEQ3_9PEZI|nr:hypothetical protein LTR09_010018 [Extremus antarcticus]